MLFGRTRTIRRATLCQNPTINWMHPLSKNLTALFLASSGNNDLRARNKFLTMTGTHHTIESTKYGSGLKFDGVADTNPNIVIGAQQNLFLSNAATWMTIRRVDTLSGAGTGNAFGFNSPTAAQITHVWLPFVDGVVYFDFGGASGANRIAWTPGSSLVDGQAHVFIFTAGAAGSAIFCDGVKVNSQGTAISATVGAGNFGLNFNVQDNNTGRQTSVMAATWSRQLSEAEIYSLSVTPFQFVIWPEQTLKLFQFGQASILRQSHFRYRTDGDAVDATPTWGANEDTSNFYPNPEAAAFRLRVKIEKAAS